MDEASSDLLHYLASSAGSRPWLICITRRDVSSGFLPGADIDHDTIHLEPLSATGARKLAETALEEAPLPPHLTAALIERAAGNPLFLQQLIGEATVDGGETLPDSVEAAITARIDRLAHDDREFLRFASVVGL